MVDHFAWPLQPFTRCPISPWGSYHFWPAAYTAASFRSNQNVGRQMKAAISLAPRQRQENYADVATFRMRTFPPHRVTTGIGPLGPKGDGCAMRHAITISVY